MATDDNHLTVRKIAHRVQVLTDPDGTPLWMGERMVEVAPGEWMTPFGADLARVTAEAASELPETDVSHDHVRRLHR